MEKRSNEKILGGRSQLAINDTVEVISTNNKHLYGKIGKIVDIKKDKTDTDIRIKTNDGYDVWIDADDVSVI
jgi:hypothetical protein